MLFDKRNLPIDRRSCRCSPANPYELVKEEDISEVADLKSKVLVKSRSILLIDVCCPLQNPSDSYLYPEIRTPGRLRLVTTLLKNRKTTISIITLKRKRTLAESSAAVS